MLRERVEEASTPNLKEPNELPAPGRVDEYRRA
jgi:hypothetical protein